ncbi:MAG: carbohydrate kinase [Ktedonobacteraceae bacterium]
MIDVTCLGEALIDMFSVEVGRPLTEVSAFYPMPGGAPANVTVAVARLGASSAFIGKVGDDPFGRHLAATLAQQGVETRGMRFDEEARTGLNFHAQVDQNTATHLFYRNPSADMLLNSTELDGDLLRSTRVYYFGSISLIQEPSRGATQEALRIAREAGALIAFDVNYRPGLWSSAEAARTQMLAMLPHVNVLKLNEDEVVLLTGSSDLPTALKELEKLGPELCAVTLGPNGSAYQSRGKIGLVPPFKVEAIEPTGSGDAFMATLLVQLLGSDGAWRDRLASASMHDLLRRANAAGALTATKKGAFAGFPTIAAVAELVRLQA